MLKKKLGLNSGPSDVKSVFNLHFLGWHNGVPHTIFDVRLCKEHDLWSQADLGSNPCPTGYYVTSSKSLHICGPLFAHL